jgi:hypothetical protein
MLLIDDVSGEQSVQFNAQFDCPVGTYGERYGCVEGEKRDLGDGAVDTMVTSVDWLTAACMAGQELSTFSRFTRLVCQLMLSQYRFRNGCSHA